MIRADVKDTRNNDVVMSTSDFKRRGRRPLVSTRYPLKKVPKTFTRFVSVLDKTGFGAKLYPIMNVIPKPDAKPLPMPVKMIFCPGKKQLNGASE